MSIESTVQELIRKYAGPSIDWKHGDIVKHPEGYDVKITGGSYFGNYNRVSNFWYWRRVADDGTISETEEHGYGW